MNKKEIIQYLDFLGDSYRINKSEDPSNGSEYESRIDMISSLKKKLEWQYKSQEEKRDLRIAWVRSLEKRGKNVSEMKKVISLYEAILLLKPYLKIYINDIRIQGLIDLCNKYLRLIDYSGRNVHLRIDHEELNAVFNPFLSNIDSIDSSDLNKIRNLHIEISENIPPS